MDVRIPAFSPSVDYAREEKETHVENAIQHMTYLEPILPLLLIAVTLALAIRRYSPSKALLWLSILLLWLVTLPLLPLVFLRPAELSLQASAAKLQMAGSQQNAIVVLASTVSSPPPGSTEPVFGPDTRERCVYAAELYRRFKPIRVIASGGGGSPVPEGSYAGAMKRALVLEGVPEDAVIVESASHSTYENALFTARLLRSLRVRSIFLVTSAYHMKRASAAFRKQSLEVMPAASDYRISSQMCWLDWLPSSNYLEMNDALLHEWVGFAYYRWKGWV
jgi:uncharacterized SAM-binding protein YcdF (DUF218 family)